MVEMPYPGRIDFAMDIWYIDHCSFWLDIKIIGLTIKQLLAGKSNEIKMPVFTGANQSLI